MSESLLWLAGGLVLLVAEVMAPGLFMFWIGLAALGTGVVVQLFDPSLGVKVVTFAVLAAIAITAAMRLRRLDSHQARSINTAESGLVGRPAHALAFTGRQGRVRLGDSDWSARLADDTAPPEPGALLEVVGVNGTVLIVRAVPSTPGLTNP